MAIIVRQKLVSSSKYDIKCPYSLTPEFIVVHNTANDASADSEVSYMINNNNEVSFHYAIDDKEVVQGIPANRNAWQAGDGGSGQGNRKGLSIEICYSKSGGTRFVASEKLAAKFIAQELKSRGWGIDKVKKHQDFSGKYCPHRTLDMGWQRFLDMIKIELLALTPQPTPTNLYRIRKTWADAKSQIGAFSNLESAKDLANSNPGYYVFDEAGKIVYPIVSTGLYRVRKTWVDVKSQIGAFSNLESAKDLANSNPGYYVFDEAGKIVYPIIVKEQLYRVRKTWADASSQAGAFKNLDSAKLKADELKSQGYKVFDEAGKAVYFPSLTAVESVDDKENTTNSGMKTINKHNLVEKSELTAYQLSQFLLQKNSNPKINCSAEELAKLFIDEGESEGIRGDIAFIQSCHETGYFTFTGDAKPEWNNYSGIGVTGIKYDSVTSIEKPFIDGVITIWDPNNKSIGVKFESPLLGVRAQIQHLKAYATSDPLKQICVDPRYKYINPLGKAPTLEDLAGKWAVPGYSTNQFKTFTDAWNADTTYGQLIWRLVELAKQLPKEQEVIKPEMPKEPVKSDEPEKFEESKLEQSVEDSKDDIDKAIETVKGSGILKLIMDKLLEVLLKWLKK